MFPRRRAKAGSQVQNAHVNKSQTLAGATTMTKLSLAALAVLAVLSGSAFAGPNSNAAPGWATQTDFQLQGR